MSKIALESNPSGTGTFTIKSPDSNVDRELVLPDEAGTVLTNDSDIEPQVKAATNAGGSAPIFACRAWVNFNGANGSIRASGNVSSVTRNGPGDYTINFATAMPDANYTVSGSAATSTTLDAGQYNRGVTLCSQTLLTGSFRIRTSNLSNTTVEDSAIVTVNVNR